MKTEPVNVTISRPMNQSGGDFISITISGQNSRVEVMEVKMPIAEFAKAITGQGYCKGVGILRGADKFGLKMENKPFEFKLPDSSDWKTRKSDAAGVVKFVCPDGWEPDSYFSSQDSFFSKGGEQWARCTIRRWVPVEDETIETE